MNDRVRNIGIFAHVDAGKTTLSERLLLETNEIRQAGAVDAGTAHTDRLDVERRRGISVKTACAPVTYKNTLIRLIDTPGHADFISEIERGMWAIDGAVLLISGPDGVQPQTETLFSLLAKNKIPTLIFVNKLDRNLRSFSSVVSEARSLLSPLIFDAESGEDAMAAAAEADDEALSAYMDGEIWPKEKLRPLLSSLCREGKFFPAVGGSALTGEGVTSLMDAIVDFLPPPEGNAQSPLSGVVFAVEPDPAMGRAAYVRLFSGSLRNRDTISLRVTEENDYAAREMDVDSKITQIRAIGASGRGDDVGAMSAGDIALIYGLGSVRTGQILGDKSLLPPRVSVSGLRPPLFMAQVVPDSPDSLPALKKALEQLSAEDPLLGVSVSGQAVTIRLMGAIQIEVLQEDLLSRFGLKTRFTAPEVIYRETIKQTSVGFYAYTMPKPCWAVIKFEISPSPRGSGVTFESLVGPREIKYRYQHQVEQAIPLATRQGMLGWQVDDVHIRLVGGGDHEIHTHPLDFIVATPIAFMDGLRRAGSVLLEPILEMELYIDEGAAGRVIGEINAMRGSIRDTRSQGGKRAMTCEVPAAECADFPIRFARLTSGRGSMTSKLLGYRECDLSLGKTCPRHGVDPLDTSKYILAARSALDGGIFG